MDILLVKNIADLANEAANYAADQAHGAKDVADNARLSATYAAAVAMDANNLA